ncbi:MAG: DNA double-strand break repair nuclease NurA [Thermoanaerobacteraceae bacterium]|nr:DNA double-strand break repair nuclease NurA [Thermoanaerobacteraceae bacterium]
MRLRLKQKPSIDALRNMIIDKGIGSFNNCRKLNKQDLLCVVERGKIVGVDGSTNSSKGHFPYIITLQQAMAKPCSNDINAVTTTDALSPLTMGDILSEEEYRDFVKQNLAGLEVKAALAAIEQFCPRVILLDGSLVRYKIEAAPLWEELKSRALAGHIILVGVVEGISTNLISQCLKDDLSEAFHQASDWEILFGLLKVGERLEIAQGLFKEGFRTFFMRSSLDPKPIGIDLLEEQQIYLNEVANLVYTLTPRDGRGIPLWLDIIDKSVRISDKVMEGLLSTYLGEDYIEFIKPKREKREF